jgi:hypothetical protein
MEWQVADNVHVDVQGNWTESTFHRESPTVLVITPGELRRHGQLYQ